MQANPWPLCVCHDTPLWFSTANLCEHIVMFATDTVLFVGLILACFTCVQLKTAMFATPCAPLTNVGAQGPTSVCPVRTTAEEAPASHSAASSQGQCLHNIQQLKNRNLILGECVCPAHAETLYVPLCYLQCVQNVYSCLLCYFMQGTSRIC